MSRRDDVHSSLSDIDIRVRALESVLVEKGYVEQAALDQIVEAHETRIGPHIGASRGAGMGGSCLSSRVACERHCSGRRVR